MKVTVPAVPNTTKTTLSAVTTKEDMFVQVEFVLTSTTVGDGDLCQIAAFLDKSDNRIWGLLVEGVGSNLNFRLSIWHDGTENVYHSINPISFHIFLLY